MQAPSFAQSRSDQTLGMVIVIGLHVLAGAGLLMLAQPVLQQMLPPTFQVRFLTEQPKLETIAPPQPEPPKPLPVKQQVVQPRQVQPKPAPAPVIQADAPAAPDAPVMTAPPAPKDMPPAAPAPSAAQPAQEAYQEPRHDADYLRNPNPAYPRASRSLGEEGTVRLRIEVSAEGKPLQVLIEKTSGFPRLDRAAQETVASSWRFTPARKGQQAVAAWVIVPVTFSLNR
ncbi:energy transducer TonB [Uliginosibacterium paludis]|uniref:Protein TonB n=1 Tax=Uliginosibacterium paludis TaxID=1615952 RepID=A0ABV2CQQ5_9RHOO